MLYLCIENVDEGETEMSKKAEKVFGANYKIIICVFIFFVAVLPTALFLSERRAYVQEKREAVYRLQQSVDTQINSVKKLMNYTFFDEDFQNNLVIARETGDRESYAAVYARLTSVSILGDVVKDVWYFAEDDIEAKSPIAVSDAFLSYLSANGQTVQETARKNGYKNGEYFFFDAKRTKDGSGGNGFAVLGHRVMSAGEATFMQPVGVAAAVIDLRALTGEFSALKETGVNAAMLSHEGKILYSNERIGEFSEKHATAYEYVYSEYFGLRTVLYYPMTQPLIEFLPLLFAVLGVAVCVCAVFYIYVRVNDNRRLSGYRSFLESFTKIAEGDLKCRVSECDIEGLNQVAKSFNDMMDALEIVNKKFAEEENLRLSAELKKDEYLLKYLGTQMNKHFIFNTFGTIRSLINLKRNGEAVQCTDMLCDYLRLSFKTKSIVAVKRELEALQAYIGIQSIRFPCVTVSVRVAEEIFLTPMPQFVLQPLVENCYKHAFANGQGNITIVGEKVDPDRIRFTISDDGRGIAPETLHRVRENLRAGTETNDSGNVGLINVLNRLQLLTDESAFIGISDNGEGTTVTIEFKGKQAE